MTNVCNNLQENFAISNKIVTLPLQSPLIKKEVSIYKYKLVKKINPQDKEAPKKWYAIPISEVPQTVKAMTRTATENTTTAPIEMEAALELLGRHARQQLQQGHTVKVGDLGTIRVSFKSDVTILFSALTRMFPKPIFAP